MFISINKKKKKNTAQSWWLMTFGKLRSEGSWFKASFGDERSPSPK
jgi:hypothetical protein